MVEYGGEAPHDAALFEFVCDLEKLLITEAQSLHSFCKRLFRNVDILLQLFDDRDMQRCQFDCFIGSFFDLLFPGPLAGCIHFD